MTKTQNAVRLERALDVAEWERVLDVLRDRREERAERDLQSSIRIQNFATYTMFRIVDGVK